MRNPTKLFAAVTILAISAIALPAQQDKASRPSPPATADCTLSGGQKITIDYSSPRMKGRKIFGSLVPYGQVWRAGANEATAMTVGADVTIGGKPVPAGKYTLFAIPDQNKWTLIISKKTGEWGTAYPGPENDLARIDMKAEKTPAPVENFTIKFDQTPKGCTLRMQWETTQASVEIVK